EQHNQSLIARLNAAYIGRDEAKTKLGAALVERDEAVAARDAFGQKAHQLQEQVDAMTATVTGLLLEGWWCPCAKTDKSPGIFNSDAKERLTACRACGAARPT
ncbi:MAG TPA: hypothetical protein VIJ22_10650, partial [Polyangiaceae bacterium]